MGIEYTDADMIKIPDSPAPPADLYFVMAYISACGNGKGRWKIWPEQWATKQEAVEEANKLGHLWKWKRIVRVRPQYASEI